MVKGISFDLVVDMCLIVCLSEQDERARRGAEDHEAERRRERRGAGGGGTEEAEQQQRAGRQHGHRYLSGERAVGHVPVR